MISTKEFFFTTTTLGYHIDLNYDYETFDKWHILAMS